MPSPMIDIPFANQVGQSAVSQNSQEVLTNMFAEIDPSGRRRIIRRQRRALTSVKAQAGEKRAIEKVGALHYYVIANKAYSWDGTTQTEIGTLSTSTGRCSITYDEDADVLISDGTNGYHWDGATFASVTAQSDIGHVTFLSGYALYNEPGTAVFWWSDLNDMETWGALDFATAEAEPDTLVRVFAFNGMIWLFGEKTIEVWQLVGGDAVFSRQTASVIDRGLGAAFAVAAEDNTICWMGNDFIVYRDDGYNPQVISTRTVERQIEALDDDVKAAAEMFTYTDQGHKFLTLRFPGSDGGLTFQYNFTTQLWNRCKTYERDDWDIMGGASDETDYYLTTAGVCSLVRGSNQDEGAVMERGGVSQTIADGSRRLSIRAFFLDAEFGGVDVEEDAPTVMLRVSRDGETFSNELWRDANLGVTGDYTHQAVWRNLGIGRKWQIEVLCTDDVEFSILGADAVFN